MPNALHKSAQRGQLSSRRGKLSAIASVRSPLATPVSSDPDVHVWRDGARDVTVEAPEHGSAPRQTETFRLTKVLPSGATPAEVFAGVGGPVVDWLWDGFNAVVLSYGQSGAGKTSLLLGHRASPTTPAVLSSSSPTVRDGSATSVGSIGSSERTAATESCGAGTANEGGGLLGDVLRVLFNNAGIAATHTATTDVGDANGVNSCAGEGSVLSSLPLRVSRVDGIHQAEERADGAAYETRKIVDRIRCILTPERRTSGASLAGSADVHHLSSRNDANLVETKGSGGEGQTKARPSCLRPSTSTDYGEAAEAGVGPGIRAARNDLTVIALSAWEIAGKNVRDLFVSPPLPPTTGLQNCSDSKSTCNGSGSICNDGSGKSGADGRATSSTSPSVSLDKISSRAAQIQGSAVSNSSTCDGGKSNVGGVISGRNRGHTGGSSGKRRKGSRGSRGGGGPDGKRGRSRGRSGSDDSTNSSARPNSEHPSGFVTVKAPDLGTALQLVDMARRRRADMREEAGGGKAGTGHIFFRVVLYNGLEEMVSTLHLVDMAGGWEPPSVNESPSKKGKRSSSPSTRAGAATIVEGGTRSRPSATSQDVNHFASMIAALVPANPPVSETRPDRNIADNSSLNNHAGGYKSKSEQDGQHGVERLLPTPTPGAWHPVFGCREGKSGGSGKLVEALRPLISGNARTWMVVSVGGSGTGGPGAAWRALDVSRRATGICTSCIRLRGVALSDLRLKSAHEVLQGQREGTPLRSSSPYLRPPRDIGGGSSGDQRIKASAQTASASAVTRNGLAQTGNIPSRLSRGGVNFDADGDVIEDGAGCGSIEDATTVRALAPADGHDQSGAEQLSTFTFASKLRSSEFSFDESSENSLGKRLTQREESTTAIAGKVRSANGTEAISWGEDGTEGENGISVDKYLEAFHRGETGHAQTLSATTEGSRTFSESNVVNSAGRVSEVGNLSSVRATDKLAGKEDAVAANSACDSGKTPRDENAYVATSAAAASTAAVLKDLDFILGGQATATMATVRGMVLENERDFNENGDSMTRNHYRKGSAVGQRENAATPSLVSPVAPSHISSSLKSNRRSVGGRLSDSTVAAEVGPSTRRRLFGPVIRDDAKLETSSLVNGSSGSNEGSRVGRDGRKVTAAPAPARANIDRMMASLLEDVLPSNGEEGDEAGVEDEVYPTKSGVSGGRGDEEGEKRRAGGVTRGRGTTRPCRSPSPPCSDVGEPSGDSAPTPRSRTSSSPSAAALGASQAKSRSAVSGGKKPVRASPNRATRGQQTEQAESPLRPAELLTVGSEGLSSAEKGVFLTPIEVLMHTPAGGSGDGRQSGRFCVGESPQESTPGGLRTDADETPVSLTTRTSLAASITTPTTFVGEEKGAESSVHGRGAKDVLSKSVQPAPRQRPAPAVASSSRPSQPDNMSTSIGDLPAAEQAGNADPPRSQISRGAGPWSDEGDDEVEGLPRELPSNSRGDGGRRRERDTRARDVGAAEAAANGKDNSAANNGIQEYVGGHRRGGGLAGKEGNTGGDGSGGAVETEALLRRNYAGLLRIIKEQGERAQQMERRYELKGCDWLERVTSLEAEVEGFRAEAVEMRGRVKRAESASSSAEVFERYEAHAGLLEAENTSLRDRNIFLELRLLDILEQPTTVTKATSSSALKHVHDMQAERSDQSDTNGRVSDGGSGNKSEDETIPSVTLNRAGIAGGATKFRVDGRITPTTIGTLSGGRGKSAAAATTAAMTAIAHGTRCAGISILAGIDPAEAARWRAIKDLRRQLVEVERGARGLREERASMEKRDRQCQAQLQIASKQRQKIQEIVVKEREQEAELIASRLDSARAEALADTAAQEVAHLRDTLASATTDRKALLSELADERRKSRRFDEDRRAYGHIRRFIEQHAGGRPEEWDAEVEVEQGRRQDRGTFRGSASPGENRDRVLNGRADVGRGRGTPEDVTSNGRMLRAEDLHGSLDFIKNRRSGTISGIKRDGITGIEDSDSDHLTYRMTSRPLSKTLISSTAGPHPITNHCSNYSGAFNYRTTVGDRRSGLHDNDGRDCNRDSSSFACGDTVGYNGSKSNHYGDHWRGARARTRHAALNLDRDVLYPRRRTSGEDDHADEET